MWHEDEINFFLYLQEDSVCSEYKESGENVCAGSHLHTPSSLYAVFWVQSGSNKGS